MLSTEQNARLTRVGPDQPAGALLRRYWQPVALAEELASAERPVLPVRLLGEDLVLFADDAGDLGLIARACPHRGADLAFGRREDGGLRCAFHGWLFDRHGACLQTPAEPESSRLHQHITQPAYPVVERGGIIFAYMGPGAPPEFPAFDCFIAPPSHVFAFKGLMECNWLQALEVGIDPAHASFLHRFFEDEDARAAYGKQFRAASAGTDLPMTRILREFPRPQLEVARTEYGLRLAALRRIDAQRRHVRVTNLVFPAAIVIPMSATMTITQWHVPIDDVSCYWYAIFTSFDAPVDHAKMRAQRLELYELPEYRPRRHRGNQYGFDAREQQARTYTGMGDDINVHDQWAVESQGAIADRTREHLAASDVGIVAYRKLLDAAITQVAAGGAPALMVLDAAAAARMHGPATMDAIATALDGENAEEDWESFYLRLDAQRRQGAPWA